MAEQMQAQNIRTAETKETRQTPSWDVINEFNETFHGLAEAHIEGDKLLITISSITMVVRMPGVIGVQSTGPSNMP